MHSENLPLLEVIELLQLQMFSECVEQYTLTYRGVPLVVSLHSLPIDIETIYYLKRTR
jgi:hypothetical protein